MVSVVIVLIEKLVIRYVSFVSVLNLERCEYLNGMLMILVEDW